MAGSSTLPTASHPPKTSTLPPKTTVRGRRGSPRRPSWLWAARQRLPLPFFPAFLLLRAPLPPPPADGPPAPPSAAAGALAALAAAAEARASRTAGIAAATATYSSRPVGEEARTQRPRDRKKHGQARSNRAAAQRGQRGNTWEASAHPPTPPSIPVPPTHAPSTPTPPPSGATGRKQHDSMLGRPFRNSPTRPAHAPSRPRPTPTSRGHRGPPPPPPPHPPPPAPRLPKRTAAQVRVDGHLWRHPCVPQLHPDAAAVEKVPRVALVLHPQGDAQAARRLKDVGDGRVRYSGGLGNFAALYRRRVGGGRETGRDAERGREEPGRRGAVSRRTTIAL